MAALTPHASLSPFAHTQRLVIKIGSALLVDTETGDLRTDWLTNLCADIHGLRQSGMDIIIVSSGAIAIGRHRLGLSGRTLSLPEKQASAAAGQSHLTQAYEKALAEHDLITAQALLTLTDTEDRRRWLNARSTLETLLNLGAIPIINENDTIATDEIRFGDNDRLAARTAQMLGADTLILLSDIDGLYNDDPRKNPNAEHLPVISDLTDDILAMGGGVNMDAQVGSGGMATKLLAAQICVNAGCHMCVMDGQASHPLTRLQYGAKASWFKARENPERARRQWIKGSLKPKGQLHVDAGAATALQNDKSLLAAGITQIAGDFRKGDAVSVIDKTGQEIARGLSAYDAVEATKIIGLKSEDIAAALGYNNNAVVVHRDNLVMML